MSLHFISGFARALSQITMQWSETNGPDLQLTTLKSPDDSVNTKSRILSTHEFKNQYVVQGPLRTSNPGN